MASLTSLLPLTYIYGIWKDYLKIYVFNIQNVNITVIIVFIVFVYFYYNSSCLTIILSWVVSWLQAAGDVTSKEYAHFSNSSTSNNVLSSPQSMST